MMEESNAHATPDTQELTQRQREILTLLRAGKVNKEIARELGIGLGTVKQHVVAIFKRLRVNNRAMAAAHHGATIDGDLSEAVGAGGADQLERRPCVVLSLALPETADNVLLKRLHSALAAQAFEFQAIFLTRQGRSADLIFGIQQVHEYDLLRALQTAHAAFCELQQADPACAAQLRGGLTAGLVMASMRRFGGWSGEAIASSAISHARELAEQSPAGLLAVDQPARDLMLAFGIGAGHSDDAAIGFDSLDTLTWSGDRIAYPLVGRQDELAAWQAALARLGDGNGSLIALEGETGMGKSRLCHELATAFAQRGGTVAFLRGQPFGAAAQLRDVLAGRVRTAGDIVDLLLAAPAAPRLVIVDDLHLLAPEWQQRIGAAAATAANGASLVLLSGRKVALPAADGQLVRLRRLPLPETARLVRDVLAARGIKMRAEKLNAVVNEAAGVPLFAVELARHRGSGLLAMPLLIVVCARLDELQLDHRLLAAVARSDPPPTAGTLARLMRAEPAEIAASLDQAIASGVLARDGEGAFSFTHPVIRLVIEFLRME
jgi:DNA-binding CsgD family transcriptional regulator